MFYRLKNILNTQKDTDMPVQYSHKEKIIKNTMASTLTAEMIDWNAYRESVEGSIKNEELWALGGSDFAEDNIAELKEELECIENEDYDTILEKYDDDVMRYYQK